MFKKIDLLKSLLLVLILTFALCLSACVPNSPDNGGAGGDDTSDTSAPPVIGSLRIEGLSEIELTLGESVKLTIDHPDDVLKHVKWTVEGASVTVDASGNVTAIGIGASTVKATYGALHDTVTVNVVEEIVEPPHTHTFVDGKCECGEEDPTYKPPHTHTFIDGKCECGEEDPTYKPPHTHRFVDGKCECGETDPSYTPPAPPVDEAPVGYYISGKNANGAIYFNGAVSGGRFSATTDKSQAVLVFVEPTRNGLLLYFEKSGAKNYLVIDDNSTGASLATDASGATPFVWNASKSTFTVANEANNRAFGTDPTKTYLNFSTYDISGSYQWGAYTAADGTTPPDNGDTTFSPSDGGGELGGGSTSTGGIVINGVAIPEYSGSGYYTVNGNNPFFSDADKKFTGYKYRGLDSLGRATGAFARLTTSLLPTDEREDISHIKPTGWVQATYSSLGIDSLYNRSHLIAHSLISEDVVVENFVTGTSYFNQQIMTQFEDMVRDLVRSGSDILYRVTPYYLGNNLLCHGVLIEAYSIEDGGDDLCFCVFLYNVQPGVEIDYATGKSRIASAGGGSSTPDDSVSENVVFTFGENGTASHAEGTSIGTSKTFSEGGYSLEITNAYKVYSGARDAKGNSCLKLGITNEAGKMTFTVGANVSKVYIKAAGYKTSTGKLTVNGTTHTVSTFSNNGAYTVIEVDTSVTKTVSVATASGGFRVMIDSIELVCTK